MMFYFWKRGVGPALQGFVQALVPSVLALPKTFIPFLVLGDGDGAGGLGGSVPC